MQIPFNTKFMNNKFDGRKDSHKTSLLSCEVICKDIIMDSCMRI